MIHRFIDLLAGVDSPPYSLLDDDFLYNVWQVKDGVPTNVTQLGSPEADDPISNPVISPDGTMIAYCHGKGPFNFSWLYVIPSDGGTPVLLDDGANTAEVLHPHWRPDSGKIVYTIGDTAGHFHGDGIYEINPDGTGKSQLLASPGGGVGFIRPQYNWDGTLIAYMQADFDPTQSNPQLRVMGADGSNDHLVASMNVLNQECSQVGWASSSDRLAFEDGGSSAEVFTIDPDGTDQTTVSDTTAQWFLTKMCWAPDDSYLVGSRLRQPVSFDPASVDVNNLGSELSFFEVGRRGFYLYQGRVYFLQSDAVCSILPDGTDFRQDHVLSDTNASSWDGTSGFEYL